MKWLRVSKQTWKLWLYSLYLICNRNCPIFPERRSFLLKNILQEMVTIYSFILLKEGWFMKEWPPYLLTGYQKLKKQTSLSP